MRAERYLSALVLASSLAACTPETKTELKRPDSFVEVVGFNNIDNPGVRAQMLEESADAIARGYRDTFKISPDFSREDFQGIEKSVVSLELIFRSDLGEATSDHYKCTAWLIKTSDPDYLTFATAGHCFNSRGKLYSMTYSRLSLDGNVFEVNEKDIRYAFDSYNKTDQALIRVPKPKDLPKGFVGLDWQEGVMPDKNINLLQLGYPGVTVFGGVLFAPTVLSLGERSEDNGFSFWTEEVDLGSYPGSSGAPVVIKDKDGKLIVIGVQTDSYNSIDDKTGKYIKHAVVKMIYFSSLLDQIGVQR